MNDFRKTTPIVEIIQRNNVNLSIHLKKIEEEELKTMVKKGTQHLVRTSMEFINFTSIAISCLHQGIMYYFGR